jgi:type VI secretion system protein ImpB
MPIIEVTQKGITSAVREVPTDSTLLVLPMTLESVGREMEDEDALPVLVDGVDDALRKFKPSLHFETLAGEEATEFVAELEFRSLKDFNPENIQKRTPGKRNDLADLKNVIDLLYRLKDRWALPTVKRAWSDPAQRRQIVAAVSALRRELEKVAQSSRGGE